LPKLIGAAAVNLDSEGRVLLVKYSYSKKNGICQVEKLKIMSLRRKQKGFNLVITLF
jgi:hypothetical protein